MGLRGKRDINSYFQQGLHAVTYPYSSCPGSQKCISPVLREVSDVEHRTFLMWVQLAFSLSHHLTPAGFFWLTGVQNNLGHRIRRRYGLGPWVTCLLTQRVALELPRPVYLGTCHNCFSTLLAGNWEEPKAGTEGRGIDWVLCLLHMF